MSSRPDARHPDLDVWVRYREGELPPEREEELRDHLVECPSCLALVRDLAAFEAAEAGPWAGEDADEPATAAAIDAIVERARAEPAARAGGGLRFGRSPRTFALAATLLVAIALGSLVWALGLRSDNRRLEARLAELSAPRPGAAVVDLYPQTVTRNGRPEDDGVTLDAGTPFVTWLLHLPERTEAERFRAEIVDANGTPLWAGHGLVRDREYHTVSLGLPAGFVVGERFSIRLWPEGAPDGAVPIAVYEREVRRREAPRSR